jgi:hypothetical protein
MSRFKIINNVKIDLTAEENAIEDQRDKLHKDNELNRKLSHLRSTRNHLLAQSDWIVIKAKETGGTIPSAWKTYRQELRDLTNGLTTVDEVNAVEFPERPST